MIVIWLVALLLSFFLLEIITSKETSFLSKILPIIIGLFMIAGILLRCKIARGFTLITLYAVALFPLISNVITKQSIVLFSASNTQVFNNVEAFLTNAVWALLFIVPIYFFSNSKSMDIFFIESNPKEHLFFITIAIIMIFVYVNFSSLAFL